MKIYISADHAGYELKEKLKNWLIEHGHDVKDFGAFKVDSDDDYPDFIKPVAEAVAKEPEKTRGIVIGGSGQGEAICANRVKGVRAAVFYGCNPEIIKLSRRHNNANVLALGARFIDSQIAEEAVKIWLETPFDGERHKRRVDKIDL